MQKSIICTILQSLNTIYGSPISCQIISSFVLSSFYSGKKHTLIIILKICYKKSLIFVMIFPLKDIIKRSSSQTSQIILSNNSINHFKSHSFSKIAFWRHIIFDLRGKKYFWIKFLKIEHGKKSCIFG